METMWDYLKDERVLAGMAIVVAGLSVKILTRKKPKLPPGPTVWPVVGSLPSLRNDIAIFNEFCDKYGDIYYLQLGLFGNVPTVVLCNITLVREAYLQKQDDFAGRHRAAVIDILSANGQDLIFGDFTPEWRYLRKIAHAALRKYTSGPRFQELLERNVEMICEIFQKGGDKPQDVFPVASLMFYNIIASLCFGKKYDLDDPEFKFVKSMLDQANEMFTGFFLSDLWPAMKVLPTPSILKMKGIAKELHAFFDNVISEHQKNFDENDIRDLADFIIHSDMEMKGTGLEQYQVKLSEVFYRQILLDMFVGGTDTSRNTLTWAILLMANHPEVQKKAQKEIDDCIGREGKINNQNRAKLPYCEAVLYETLRMRHPAPLGLPHATTCDTTVGGYDLPKGTQVLVSTMRINKDPREWKNPEEFRPERFLDDHGNLAPKPNGFLPFSTGRRSCIGEAFAKSELHIILGNLLQRFSFLPPEGKKIDLTPKPSLLICIPDATKVIFKER